MDLFEEVEEIMGQGEICDSCLGQIFANRGHGLTNRERGRAWKTVLAMENEKIVEREVVKIVDRVVEKPVEVTKIKEVRIRELG